ncbi:hypothetical protein AB1Y20_003244 [Prymnesium parvum]|uniref:Uncharacterized protein n=1 Tax=Prymnesium parvum TaxID=97485 RepID=A0AB34JBA5_PRYPA
MRRGSAAGRPSAAAPAAAPAAPSHGDTPRAHPDLSRPSSATAAPPCCSSSTLRRKSVANTSRPSSAFLPHGRHPHEPPRIAQPFSYQRSRPASACPSCRRRASAPGAPAGRSAEAGAALPLCEELAASRRADEHASEAARCASTVSHITWVMREQLRAHMHLELSGMTDSNIHQARRRRGEAAAWRGGGVARRRRGEAAVWRGGARRRRGEAAVWRGGGVARRRCGEAAVWRAGGVARRRCGEAAAWRGGGVARRRCGEAAVWRGGGVARRRCGEAAVWRGGGVAKRRCGEAAVWRSGGVARRRCGEAAVWRGGGVARRRCGEAAVWRGGGVARRRCGEAAVWRGGGVAARPRRRRFAQAAAPARAQVAESLRENSSITSLNLSFCPGIRDKGAFKLGKALKGNTTVVHVNLAGCTGITDEGAEDLCVQLVDHPSVRVISFAGCWDLGDRLASACARCLAPELSSGLRSINLSGCRLTDEGLTCLAKALWENVSLERLQLQGCLSISEAGFVALGEALEHNTSVRFIDLSWCEELTDRSLLRIGSALEQNYMLHKLKLTCCFRITDAGVKLLAKALENNNSLKELDLSWYANIGRSAGALVALSSALQKNHTLTSVDLTGCACNTSSSDRIAVAMTELKLLLDRNSKRPKSFATTLLMKEPLASTGNRSRRSFPANSRDSSARVHNRFDPIATDSIRLMLQTAITRGAQLFNVEDSEACFHLFVGTAKTLTGMVHFQPLENALKRSSDYTLDIKSRTWKLRTVFDEILEELEDDSRE